MALNLLFLPLLGGYIFYTRFNLTAYSAVRAQGQHLIFRAAACGLILLIASRLVTNALPDVIRHPDAWLAGPLYAVPGFGALLVLATVLFLTQSRATGMQLLRSEPALALALFVAEFIGILWLFLQTPSIDFQWLVPSCIVLAVGAIVSRPLVSVSGLELPVVLTRLAMYGFIGVLMLAALAVKATAVNSWWERFSPYQDSGTALLACALGAGLWIPFNMFYPYKSALDRLHTSGKTDAMDRFLWEATEQKALVQLTLADGKFYIGNIQALPPNPLASNAFVRMLPMMSGYRHKDTRELNFTGFYEDVYNDLVKERDFTEDKLAQFIKVLPFASITSANRFDPDSFVKFKSDPAPSGTDAR